MHLFNNLSIVLANTAEIHKKLSLYINDKIFRCGYIKNIDFL